MNKEKNQDVFKADNTNNNVQVMGRTSRSIGFTISKHKVYKSRGTDYISSFRTVSMIPSNLRGLLDVYFYSVSFGGIF